MLDQAIGLDDSPSYRSNRGNLRLLAGDFAGAIADFDAAIKLDPEHTRTWALRGQVRLMQGDAAKAAADLDVVLRLETPPKMYETLVLHALVLLAKGDVAHRAQILEQVVRERPDHLRGKFAKGVLDELDGRHADAVAGLSAATGDPTVGAIRPGPRHRAWLALGCGGVPAAAADAERLVALPGVGGALAFDAAGVLARASAARPRWSLAAGPRSVPWPGRPAVPTVMATAPCGPEAGTNTGYFADPAPRRAARLGR